MFGRSKQGPTWGVQGGDLFVQRHDGKRSYHGNDEQGARSAFNGARRDWFGSEKSSGGIFGGGSKDSGRRGMFG